MKYGVCLPTFRYGAEPTLEHIEAVARRAEQLGYDSVWTGDHVLVPSSAQRMRFFTDPFVTLAWVAGITEQITLGTSVVVATLRNPVVMAKQAASLDFLSRGRLVLGLGLGWLKQEFEFVGVPHDRAAARFDETIGILRALWSDCPATFAGTWYAFTDAVLEPRPHREGGPPIWVGGSSEAAYRRAGRLADAWHSDDTPAADVARARAIVRAYAADAGRDCEVTSRVTVKVGAERGAGTGDRGPGYYRAGDAWPGLAGCGAALKEQVEEFQEAGATHFIAQFAHATVDEHLAALEAFARDVIHA